MPNDVSAKVDYYFTELFLEPDAALESALRRSDEANLPSINVTPLQGKFLHLLAQIHGAKKILEIGTLGGYSTIWLARALPSDGSLITLESENRHADVARRNIQEAGLEKIVDLRVGFASELLPKIAEEGAGPFDLVFIDADKPSNPLYFEWALKLTRPGSIIIVDNVVRDGAVADEGSTDSSIIAVRRMTDIISKEPSVSATVIQTVGSKGYDGFALALVLA
jgi:predicted O-methyltransferase YrrM